MRDRERKLLTKIDEAFARIESGIYGHCEECDGDIGIERLKARPVTTLCIACKSAQEARERKARHCALTVASDRHRFTTAHDKFKMKVRKAVVVAAGMGTRMLPASKVIPKEILPVVDTPAIQVVVEEAVASGIEEIVIVISPGQDHGARSFQAGAELERHLEERGKHDLLEVVRRSNNLARITIARSASAAGPRACGAAGARGGRRRAVRA